MASQQHQYSYSIKLTVRLDSSGTAKAVLRGKGRLTKAEVVLAENATRKGTLRIRKEVHTQGELVITPQGDVTFIAAPSRTIHDLRRCIGHWSATRSNLALLQARSYRRRKERAEAEAIVQEHGAGVYRNGRGKRLQETADSAGN